MILRAIVTCVAWLCLTGPALEGHAQPYDAGHAEVELISERRVAVPGETIFLALDKTIDPEWHVYWRNAGDAGLPPEIFWDDSPLGEKTEDGDFIWPLPKLLPVVPDEIMDYGYDDRLTLPFPVTVPEDAVGSIRFDGVADYLICRDICIPESAPVSLTLMIGDVQEPDTASAVKIASALASAPAAFEGRASFTAGENQFELSLAPATAGLLSDAQLRFFPYGHEIRHAAGQVQSEGPAGASLGIERDLREAVPARLEGVIAATWPDGRRAGFVIAAELADAPIPGTSGTLIAPAPERPGETSGGTHILVLAGLAILGGLILNLMPCVLPVLSIKAMGMVSAAGAGKEGHLRAHGLWYTAGVLVSFAALAAAFLALRGVGEFWALGSLLQYPVVVAMLALAAFALGLWLLGVFELGGSLQNLGSKAARRSGSAGAFATGALAATAGAPCVGPFVGASLGAVMERPAPEVLLIYLMLGFGLALPFLALSFVPGLARFLPRPGAWMERVKQFFAFPMFLTAAALLFVLGEQAGTSAVAWLVMGAALLAFGVWVIGAAGGRLRPAGLALGALAMLAGIALPLSTARTLEAGTARTTAYAAEYQTEPWSPQRVAQLQAEGRGIFVDFTATWCMICQANKRSTLTRADVLAAMDAANITFLVADFTNKDPVIGEELKRRGRPGVPMYLLYGPGASEPVILPAALTPGLVKREIAALAG